MAGSLLKWQSKVTTWKICSLVQLLTSILVVHRPGIVACLLNLLAKLKLLENFKLFGIIGLAQFLNKKKSKNTMTYQQTKKRSILCQSIFLKLVLSITNSCQKVTRGYRLSQWCYHYSAILFLLEVLSFKLQSLNSIINGR